MNYNNNLDENITDENLLIAIINSYRRRANKNLWLAVIFTIIPIGIILAFYYLSIQTIIGSVLVNDKGGLAIENLTRFSIYVASAIDFISAITSIGLFFNYRRMLSFEQYYVNERLTLSNKANPLFTSEHLDRNNDTKKILGASDRLGVFNFGVFKSIFK